MICVTTNLHCWQQKCSTRMLMCTIWLSLQNDCSITQFPCNSMTFLLTFLLILLDRSELKLCSLSHVVVSSLYSSFVTVQYLYAWKFSLSMFWTTHTLCCLNHVIWLFTCSFWRICHFEPVAFLWFFWMVCAIYYFTCISYKFANDRANKYCISLKFI